MIVTTKITTTTTTTTKRSCWNSDAQNILISSVAVQMVATVFWSVANCSFLNTWQHILLLSWRRSGIAAVILKRKLKLTVAWNLGSVLESSFYENSSIVAIKSGPFQTAAGCRRQLNALSLRQHVTCARCSSSCKTYAFNVIVQIIQLGQSLDVSSRTVWGIIQLGQSLDVSSRTVWAIIQLGQSLDVSSRTVWGIPLLRRVTLRLRRLEENSAFVFMGSGVQEQWPNSSGPRAWRCMQHTPSKFWTRLPNLQCVPGEWDRLLQQRVSKLVVSCLATGCLLIN